MNILMGKQGTPLVDITGRLKDGVDLAIHQRQERKRADRVVSTLRLVLSNRDNYFSNLVLGEPSTTIWEVHVYENGRRLMNGYLDQESIRWGLKSLWLEADVLAKDKLFWEKAKVTRLRTLKSVKEPHALYVTLAYIMERELTGLYRTTNPFAGMFRGIDLGAFSIRPIRFSKRNTYTSGAASFTATTVTDRGTPNYTELGVVPGLRVTADTRLNDGTPVPLTGKILTVNNTTKVLEIDRWVGFLSTSIPRDGLAYQVGIDPAVGLEGMWISLDPETTVADFLRACAVKYEAEFFIDPDSDNFTMRPRQTVLTDRATTEGLNIDTVLRDDKDPTIRYLDHKKYDYVRMELGGVVVPPPDLVAVRAGTKPFVIGVYGLLRYQMTLVFANFESAPSDLLDVHISWEQLTSGVEVLITLPTVQYPGVIARHLYRLESSDPEGKARRLATINDNTTTTYTDQTATVYTPDDPNRINFTTFPPDSVASQGIYIRYDEAAGVWNTPTVDITGGENTPAGEILVVAPSLRFMSLDDKTKQSNNQAGAVIRFFGNEPFTPGLIEPWKRLFISTREAATRVKGLNYRIGDSIRSNRALLPNDSTQDDRYLIREARNVINRDYTDLTLVSI